MYKMIYRIINILLILILCVCIGFFFIPGLRAIIPTLATEWIVGLLFISLILACVNRFFIGSKIHLEEQGSTKQSIIFCLLWVVVAAVRILQNSNWSSGSVYFAAALYYAAEAVYLHVKSKKGAKAAKENCTLQNAGSEKDESE